MASPRLLDGAVLDALDAWVIQRGAGVLLAERIHPLDAAEVERQAAAIGVRMSHEARVWSVRYGGGGQIYVDLLPGLARLSLGRALEACRWSRSAAAEFARVADDDERLGDRELWWSEAWGGATTRATNAGTRVRPLEEAAAGPPSLERSLPVRETERAVDGRAHE